MRKLLAALFALAIIAGFGASASASSSIPCNGNTYTWPDQFLNYNYVTNWPLLVNDCITDMAGKVTSATTQATSAATSATNAATSATSAANYAAALTDVSTTSVTIGTGSKTFTVSSSKQFASGQFVLVSSSANAANYMHGQITSYSGTSLVVNVLDTGGSGTFASWNVSISGSQGAAGSLPTIANGHLIGNSTGGSATAADTTLTALIDQAVSSTQGAILYRNSSSWVALAPGTSGQFLQTQGASANPQWSSQTAPGLLLISTQTANNTGSTLQWVGLGSTYNRYLLSCQGLQPSLSAQFGVQFGEGGTPTWETASYSWDVVTAASGNAVAGSSSTSNARIIVSNSNVTTSAAYSLSLDAVIDNIASSSIYKVATYRSSYFDSAGTVFWTLTGSGVYLGDTGAVTAVRVQATSGNIAAGQCSLYGIAN